MQLLNLWTLNALLTTLFVTGFIASIVTIVVNRLYRGNLGPILFATFSFSTLGFVTGLAMGNSREAAVGTVLPAVLTLLGGVAAFMIGVKGLRTQSITSAVLLCFTLALMMGAFFGDRLRLEYQFAIEDPAYVRLRGLASEQNKLAFEVQRLENYIEILKLTRDFAAKEKLDLSKFSSSYEKTEEKKEPEKKQAAAVAPGTTSPSMEATPKEATP